MTLARQRGAEFKSLFDPSQHLTIPNAPKQADPSYRTARFRKWGEAMAATPGQCGFNVSNGETGNGTGDSEDLADLRRTGEGKQTPPRKYRRGSIVPAFFGEPFEDAERISPGLVFHRPPFTA